MSMQSRIEDAGRKLSDEIEKSVSLVTVHEKVQKVSDDIIAELDNRAYRLASLLPELPVSERSQDLESLESAYTMETERQIHESLSRANRSQIIEKEAAAHNPEEPSFFTDSHEAVLTELCVGDASQPTNRQEKVGAEKAAEFDENVEFF
jgi:hypothetical protein